MWFKMSFHLETGGLLKPLSLVLLADEAALDSCL